MDVSWSPSQYLKFEDHRTRPSIDLLNAVPNSAITSAVDLGCGPGNSTEIVARRYGDAHLRGIDSSVEMISAARIRLPNARFEVDDIARWQPSGEIDLLFANAALQWLPDHRTLLPRLVSYLTKGGSLAVQMPDNLDEPSHVSMRQAAGDPRWVERLKGADAERAEILTPSQYYALLMETCERVDIWKTVYYHPLRGVDSIIEWFKSTGLLPYLGRLNEDERQVFLDVYRQKLAAHYPVLSDGTVLLAFPRIFIVARR